MGRVVKGVQLRVERYQLRAPEVAPPPPEPVIPSGDVMSPDAFAFGAGDDAFLADAPLGAAPASPAVDVEAIRAQAQGLIDDAERNAEMLLADAHNRSRALVEDAAARADTIAQDARKRGHDEGFQAGRDAADREMNDMLVTMRGILEMARAERHKLIEDAEPELVRLALGIAERVLHQQVALDRGVVVEMAKGAIARLIERDTVTVRVHPADLERMREHRDELIAIGDIRSLRIVEDQRVDRGGVVVDTDAGTIDARIATQLEEARKILHIEDDVIVEPAPVEITMAKSDVPAIKAS
ncbi:MAG TPA: FliH/SctL family protein [Candidatus Elarobacter sp.]|jgi:flagellar assembly protein FliH